MIREGFFGIFYRKIVRLEWCWRNGRRDSKVSLKPLLGEQSMMTLADAESNARVIRVYSVAAKKDLDYGRHNR